MLGYSELVGSIRRRVQSTEAWPSHQITAKCDHEVRVIFSQLRLSSVSGVHSMDLQTLAVAS